jgi:predicted dehydrogenase
MSGNFIRRDFLRQGAAALTALSYSRVLGANERMQLGLIGCGDRGSYDLGNFLKRSDIDAVAICDVYGARMDRAQQKAPQAKRFNDHRKLLELKDLDIALIATPDHWHAPCAIDALNAGKDVFIEKPLTLGMQQRSGKHYIRAKKEYIDAGRLGKITLVRTWWHGNGYHLRRAPESLQTKPADLDWTRFLGPVTWRDYDPQQFYNWRAYLDFGGGQVTDLFTHWIDVVHMFMGHDIPKSAGAAGGVYNYKDGRTAPDTINVLLEYPDDYTVSFEATLVPGISGAAIEFCGTKGRLLIDRQHFAFTPAGRNPAEEIVFAEGVKPGMTMMEAWKAEGSMDLDHVNNFLECVKSRKLPNGDVLIGHRSAQASHLGNIAYVERRRLDFDPVREEILPF